MTSAFWKPEFLSEHQVILLFKRTDIITNPHGPENVYFGEQQLLSTAMKICRNVVLETLDKFVSLLDSAILNHLAVTNPMVFDVENLTKLNEIKKKAIELEIPCLLGVTEGIHKHGEVYVTDKTMLAVGPLPYSKSKDFLNKIARELELGSKKLRYDLVDLINYNEEEMN